jgi:hypothetical protein
VERQTASAPGPSGRPSGRERHPRPGRARPPPASGPRVCRRQVTSGHHGLPGRAGLDDRALRSGPSPGLPENVTHRWASLQRAVVTAGSLAQGRGHLGRHPQVYGPTQQGRQFQATKRRSRRSGPKVPPSRIVRSALVTRFLPPQRTHAATRRRIGLYESTQGTVPFSPRAVSSHTGPTSLAEWQVQDKAGGRELVIQNENRSTRGP